METKDLIDVAIGKCAGTTRDHWTLTANGAAIHKDAHVCEGAEIAAGVIVRRGWIGEGARIFGGTIRGGTILGGTIWGGTILGGTIRGGTIRGGIILGGTILGGTIRGGTIWGGIIRGGIIRGGTIRGGTIRGGIILGGIIKRQPFVVMGLLPWQATVCAPSTLAIGCERHTFADWRERLDEIAAIHGVNAATKAKVLQVIDMAEAWHAENPIEAEQEAAATK